MSLVPSLRQGGGALLTALRPSRQHLLARRWASASIFSSSGSTSGVAFGTSGLHGIGVFATKDFSSGDLVEACPCLWVAKASLQVEPSTGSSATGKSSSNEACSGAPIDLLDYLFDPGALAQCSLTEKHLLEERRATGQLLLPLGCGLGYNHGGSGEFNTRYQVRLLSGTPLLMFTAIRQIRVGEELLIDYGEDWWSNRGWWPLSNNSTVVMRRRMERKS
eukprot:TRINITY_DN20896_c0_g1_i1.p1 TRINITY_DN20896_c0_g1~~TRINITY_DN20896_c0_g1_i1.p1  ORF type:complete len:220 (+),score=17.34 TRINITY_DN20896_c0_g1_i1:51-710(+)